MATQIDEMLPLVYNELRRLAASYVRGERRNHELQPTAIVHEAYLRLCRQAELDWRDHGHLIAFAARTMRQILVDYAREALCAKRGGGEAPITWTEALKVGNLRPPALVALDDALAELAKIDPRKVAIVELHFFAGLSFDEIAEHLGISRPTVFREWSRTRVWLYCSLAEGGRGAP